VVMVEVVMVEVVMVEVVMVEVVMVEVVVVALVVAVVKITSDVHSDKSKKVWRHTSFHSLIYRHGAGSIQHMIFTSIIWLILEQR